MIADDLAYCLGQAAFFMRAAADWHVSMRGALAGGDELREQAVKLQIEGEIYARSARFWRDLAFPQLSVAE